MTRKCFWRDALRRGVVANSSSRPVTVQLSREEVARAREAIVDDSTNRRSVHVDPPVGLSAAGTTVELSLRLSRTLHDGRFADNAWLQELPDPVTKLTWDNAAYMSPGMARDLVLETGDVVTLQTSDVSVEIPAMIVPGHADASVTVALGYGREGSEAIARGVGVNANALRSSASGLTVGGVSISSTGKHTELAVTQRHWLIEGRGESILGRNAAATASASISDDRHQKPLEKRDGGRRPLTLYEPPMLKANGVGADQWAMTIDLDQCTGCSACVVACQSENNIPIVGKVDVLKGREMHWMRIDRYVSDDNATSINVQPMLCQHCEKAPCEYVCPVNATVHSDDGLNEMVYNRCVGTRFCSNNCPYKVRRFNWYEYNGDVSEPEKMQKNPDVTVRARGVMEKCTFCIQRIRRAQRDADLAGEPYTGPVQTACQQTCPSQAIVFGSLTSTDSEVAALSALPRAFSALEELGTVPRVRYLSKAAPEKP